MDLNKLLVTYVSYDLDEGFFWIEFDNKKSIQCCLVERKDGKGYRKAISKDDNGHEWGICGDVNAWAKSTDCEDYESFDKINDFLIKQARMHGLKVLQTVTN